MRRTGLSRQAPIAQGWANALGWSSFLNLSACDHCMPTPEWRSSGRVREPRPRSITSRTRQRSSAFAFRTPVRNRRRWAAETVGHRLEATLPTLRWGVFTNLWCCRLASARPRLRVLSGIETVRRRCAPHFRFDSRSQTTSPQLPWGHFALAAEGTL